MEARAGVMKSSWRVICSNCCLPQFAAEQRAKLLVNSLLQPKELQEGRFLGLWCEEWRGRMKKEEKHQWQIPRSTDVQKPKARQKVMGTFALIPWRFLPDWPKRDKPKSLFCRFKCTRCALIALLTTVSSAFLLRCVRARADQSDAASLHASRRSHATFQVMQSKQSS